MVFMNYDIAIIGGGNAGLSFAKQLFEKRLTTNIIIIEPIEAKKKQATWCSWQANNKLDLNDTSIKGIWDKWRITNNQETVFHESAKYKYVCRDAATYLNNIEAVLENNDIRILRDKVISATLNNNKKLILCESGTITANHVYDSRGPQLSDNLLKQHFTGVEFELEKGNISVDKCVTLMDFSVTQESGLHFIYALPFSDSRIFVESTVISKQLNSPEWYKEQINTWLKQKGMKTSRIISSERGIIVQEYLKTANDITHHIGAGGGATRLATGYAFHNINHQIDLLIQNIKSNNYNVPMIMSAFTMNMDQLFNKVLINNPALSVDIFVKTAKALSGDQFSDFMLNQTNFNIWYKIVRNMPKTPFIRELIKKFGDRW